MTVIGADSGISILVLLGMAATKSQEIITPELSDQDEQRKAGMRLCHDG
jgi:hypothetical protein